MPLSGQHVARAFFFQKSSEVSKPRIIAPQPSLPTKPQKTEKKGIKSSKRRKERVKKEEKRGKKCKKGLTKGEESGNIIKLRKGAGAREARETGSAREGARDCDFERTKMSKRNLKKV